jgi:hypothetical protein
MQVHENTLNITYELRKKWTLKVQYFFMKIHASALNLTSDLRKKWSLKVQYFFMKIHASAWQRIESHIWTKKRVNSERSIFFHENSCKCMTMHWISHIWTKKKSELWKFNIFSWKFMQVHWISNLNYEQSEFWKFNIFLWKFIQVHDNLLNLTSELR